jgi:hypothetical protein
LAARAGWGAAFTIPYQGLEVEVAGITSVAERAQRAASESGVECGAAWRGTEHTKEFTKHTTLEAEGLERFQKAGG